MFSCKFPLYHASRDFISIDLDLDVDLDVDQTRVDPTSPAPETMRGLPTGFGGEFGSACSEKEMVQV